MRTVKAAVCYEYGSPLVVEEVHLESPGREEVEVRIEACAICHSDIHIIDGEWHYEAPLIPGHEAAGTVTQLGAGVEGIAVGDRVVVSLLWSCRRCRHCLEGEPYLCIGEHPLEDVHSKFTNRAGTQLNRALRVAGFAEHTVVHETQIVKVPDSIPIVSAALLACGVITGLGAVVNTAGFRFGRSVAVVGCGGVGLNTVQGAILAGATQVIGVDIEPEKLDIAREFGATHVVHAGETDAVQAVMDLSSGGVDYVFVVAGVTRLLEEAADMICKGGGVIQVGMPPQSDTFAFAGQRFMGQRSLKGSSMGGTNFQREAPQLMDLYLQGRLKLDELVTRTYPLEKINEAIAAVAEPTTLRNVITF